MGFYHAQVFCPLNNSAAVLAVVNSESEYSYIKSITVNSNNVFWVKTNLIISSKTDYIKGNIIKVSASSMGSYNFKWLFDGLDLLKNSSW
jgi:hypothetical protein